MVVEISDYQVTFIVESHTPWRVEVLPERSLEAVLIQENPIRSKQLDAMISDAARLNYNYLYIVYSCVNPLHFSSLLSLLVLSIFDLLQDAMTQFRSSPFVTWW